MQAADTKIQVPLSELLLFADTISEQWAHSTTMSMIKRIDAVTENETLRSIYARIIKDQINLSDAFDERANEIPPDLRKAVQLYEQTSAPQALKEWAVRHKNRQLNIHHG